MIAVRSGKTRSVPFGPIAARWSPGRVVRRPRPRRPHAVTFDNAVDLIDFHMYALEHRLDAIIEVLDLGANFVFAYAMVSVLISVMHDRRM